jgi:hypothetical protein
MLSPVAHAFMRQFIPRTSGRHADGILDYRPIGRAAGLSDAEMENALQELTAAGYIAYGTRSRAVFLTESGIFWWRRMQRRDAGTLAGAC